MNIEKIKTGEVKDLRGANLQGADLLYANLRGANLQGANLRGANLREANLREANLWGANLREANLWGADLRGANLWGANLREANLPETDIFLNSPYSICHVRTDFIRIGCEYHSVDEWMSFSDEEIDRMDKNALRWWKSMENVIFSVVNALGERGENGKNSDF